MEVDPAQLERLFEAAISWGGGLFAMGCVILLFRTTIQNAVAGLVWRRGAELRLDQTLLISGRKARLVRNGFLKTVFFMQNGRPTKMIVPNSQLAVLTIEAVLDPHGDDKE
mgnify:FL=1